MIWETATIIAQSSDELVYIIAVLIIIGVGWVGERIKAKMTDTGRGQTPPRPVRRPPTSLPRPHIPPMRDEHAPRHVAGTGPAHRPRPPVRPPAAPPHAPARRPIARTIEERKAVIRGEPADPRPSRPARDEILWEVPDRGRKPPPRPQPPPTVVVVEAESRTLLAKLGEKIVEAPPEPKQLGRLKPLMVEKVKVRPGLAPSSFRNLGIAELQRALILKEILEPPLALRDQPGF